MVEKEKKWTEEEYQKWLSYDKTKTINEEVKGDPRDKHDFVNFCGYNRRLRKVRPGSTKINEDENGDKYASIQVKAGDCPEEQTERNELRLDKENDFKFNENFKYKFSFKIPDNFPLSPTRLVIGQWKYNKIEGSDEKKDPSPMLAQRIKKIGGKYYFVITDGTKQKNILGKIPFDDIKGKWVDMDYELKFSDKTDENGKPIPCSVKIKANVEGKKEMDEEKEFYLADENNLQFNSKESHSGYFKFGLYRDTYDYALTKDLSRKDKKEIETAQKTDEENPMQIYFKNFSMEKLNTNTEEIEQSHIEQRAKAVKLAKQLNDEPPQTQQVQDKADQNELEKDEGKAEKDEYNYIKKMVLKNDIEGILNHIGFNSNEILRGKGQIKTIDIINKELKQKISSLGEPKNLQENSIFIKNNNETEIINETQNGYNQLYKKFIKIKEGNDNLLGPIFLKLVKNLSKEIAILEKNNIYSKLYKKIMSNKIVKNILELKKAIKNKNHDLEKNIKRLKKYENGEYIVFPKGFIYELNKGPIKEGSIIIGENEFYVSTHIEKNSKNKRTEYIKYVDSLKKARKFFKKNDIDIKYCRRCTRLANRKFIEAFEEQRKKIMGKKYKKSNILQVLEQTEKAVIFKEDKEIKKDKPNTNPIRFIDKSKKDLYKFATGDGKDLFHECVMWLDLDKL